MAETQNFNNHARYFPLFHFVLTPLLLALLIYTIVRAVQEPTVFHFALILTVLILIGMHFAARIQALKVQDRIVRLEEMLRYDRVLSPDLAMQARELPLNQIIALRFASDAELSELVSRVIGGELSKPSDIKRAVKNWRGDYLRV